MVNLWSTTQGMKREFEYIKHLLFGLDIRIYHRLRIKYLIDLERSPDRAELLLLM